VERKKKVEKKRALSTESIHGTGCQWWGEKREKAIRETDSERKIVLARDHWVSEESEKKPKF